MIELTNDILLFESVLPINLMNKLNNLIDDNYELIFNKDSREAKFPFEGLNGRLEIYKFTELFDEFNLFWYNSIENQMYDYYFNYITDREIINGYKEYAKTDWKDIFIQIYNTENESQSLNDIHIDFSGITFVANIKDKYDGGLLTFPKQNISLRLNKGDLVVFPGSHTHPHGVTNLTSGERRVLVGQSMGIKQLHKFGKEYVSP
jgi:hypothetical protein